jgi:hypothetical protein
MLYPLSPVGQTLPDSPKIPFLFITVFPPWELERAITKGLDESDEPAPLPFPILFFMYYFSHFDKNFFRPEGPSLKERISFVKPLGKDFSLFF